MPIFYYENSFRVLWVTSECSNILSLLWLRVTKENWKHYFLPVHLPCFTFMFQTILITVQTVNYQINSRQWEQKVGWRRKVAINLCPFTWCTRRRMAPRRLLKPCRSLNSLGFWFRASESTYLFHKVWSYIF